MKSIILSLLLLGLTGQLYAASTAPSPDAPKLPEHDIYDVELIVFEHQHQGLAENWPQAPGEPDIAMAQGALTPVMFCNGMWCGQSPNNIRNLLRFGYPAHKIKWFRGGMQTWAILGLTIDNP